VQDFIDNNVIRSEELFGEQIAEQLADISSKQQNTIKTVYDDNVREELSEGMVIEFLPTYNHGSLLFNNYYDTTGITRNSMAVRYKPTVEAGESSGFSYLSWVKHDYFPTTLTFDVTEQVRAAEDMLEVKLNKPLVSLKLAVGDYIINGSDELAAIGGFNGETVILKTRTDLVDFAGFHKSYTVNLFLLNESKIRATFHDARMFCIANDGRYTTMKGMTIPNEWVGVVFNISNIHKYTGLYLWKVQAENPNDKGSNQLANFYKREIKTTQPTIISREQPLLLASPSYITNIRFLKKALEFEYHSYVLSFQKLKKPSMAWIIDDAKTIFDYGNAGNGYMGDREQRP
jgi:hypothetical protein